MVFQIPQIYLDNNRISLLSDNLLSTLDIIYFNPYTNIETAFYNKVYKLWHHYNYELVRKILCARVHEMLLFL